MTPSPTHPITVPELEALARVINAHWPARVLVAGDFDLQVMAGSLARAGVTLEDARQAVEDLVADGFAWSPRAPDIMRAVRQRETNRGKGPTAAAVGGRDDVGADGLRRWERDAIAVFENTRDPWALAELERDGSDVARAAAVTARGSSGR